MSDYNVNQMDLKMLRNEVQSLRDELAIMQRKYEDILYNLDDDNFSSQLKKEKDGMKASIKVNADTITSEVAKVTEATDTKLEQYSTKTQTEEAIKSTVSKEYVDKLLGDTYVTTSTFTQKANEISTTVTDKYNGLDSKITQTAAGLSASITNLQSDMSTVQQTATELSSTVSSHSGSISNISQTASVISQTVYDMAYGEFGGYTMFEQDSGKFKFTGNVEITGDAIVGGTISGSAISNSSGSHKMVMGAENVSATNKYGVFRLYNQYYGTDMSTQVPYFSIFDNQEGAIVLYAAGTSFLRAQTSGNQMFVEPRGTWDFTDCNVYGVSGVAKFA